MKPAAYDKVIDLIGQHDNVFELEELSKAAWARIKTLRSRQGQKSRRDVEAGDFAEIIGPIKPKYLEGVVGRVERVTIEYCYIKMPVNRRYRRRSGEIVGVPWSCARKTSDPA